MQSTPLPRDYCTDFVNGIICQLSDQDCIEVSMIDANNNNPSDDLKGMALEAQIDPCTKMRATLFHQFKEKQLDQVCLRGNEYLPLGTLLLLERVRRDASGKGALYDYVVYSTGAGKDGCACVIDYKSMNAQRETLVGGDTTRKVDVFAEQLGVVLATTFLHALNPELCSVIPFDRA